MRAERMIIKGDAKLVLEFASVLASRVDEVVTGTSKEEISKQLSDAVLDLLFGTDPAGVIYTRGEVFRKYNVRLEDFPCVFDEMKVRLLSHYEEYVDAEPDIERWRSFVTAHADSPLVADEPIEFVRPAGADARVVFSADGKIQGDSTTVLELGSVMYRQAKVIVANMASSDLNTRHVMTRIWLHRAVMSLVGNIPSWPIVFGLFKSAVSNCISLSPTQLNAAGLSRVLDQCAADQNLWTDMIRRHVHDAARG